LEKPNDFERNGEIIFVTSGGTRILSFAHGDPTLRFSPLFPSRLKE